ncbi:carboxylesterase [Colletotrichum salicis]|uniref:Carboxylic ester hydrolase n=1 Tax=Colletotrichum salicis TaxID=1209931 RepID=A0A135V9Z6_9PEZI|nr:carboxylesterase [Colletotrichum salicis]
MSPTASTPSRDQRPTVRLDQGAFIGTTLSEPEFPRGVEAFLGVPYAKCQRLRRPEAPGQCGDSFDAAEYGPVCPTADPTYPADEEGCLNANVFRPAGGRVEGKKVPVLVYTHGGAFNFGRGGDRNLAAFVSFSKRDVVAVSFNYRLGPLGFLPCGVAAREGIANLGLMDQRALLEWVQRNIGKFGGDEGDVTVMGFSAGAHSLGHHLLSPPSCRLFHRAVLESGAPTARSVLAATHPRHEAQFARFLTHAGLSKLSATPEDILPAIRALPLEDFLQASLMTWSECAPSVQWPFQPSIEPINSSNTDDTSIIPLAPIKTWTSPALPNLPPLLTGFNTSEGTMFVPATASSPTALSDFFSALIPSLSTADLDTLESLYPPPSTYPAPPTASHGAQFRRLAQAYGHYGYIAPLLHSAHFASKASAGAGGAGDVPAPVWVYEYAAHADLGAANHGDHVPAATHDTDILTPHKTPGLLAVSNAMHAHWSTFATTSDPNDTENTNSSGVVSWPRFISPFGDTAADDYIPRPADDPTETRGKILVFGEGNDELMGHMGQRRRGTVARVRTLTEAEVRQFRFWWDRVGLSEGMGVAEDEGAKL